MLYLSLALAYVASLAFVAYSRTLDRDDRDWNEMAASLEQATADMTSTSASVEALRATVKDATERVGKCELALSIRRQRAA